MEVRLSEMLPYLAERKAGRARIHMISCIQPLLPYADVYADIIASLVTSQLGLPRAGVQAM